jgi:hypothetical protein
VVGSPIGRLILALQANLAAVAGGLIVAGITGRPRAGLLVAVVTGGICLVRALRTGIAVDLDQDAIVLRTCWRTARVPMTQVARIEGGTTRAVGGPDLRVTTADGRAYGSLAVAYLDRDRTDALFRALSAARDRAGFELALTRALPTPPAV